MLSPLRHSLDTQLLLRLYNDDEKEDEDNNGNDDDKVKTIITIMRRGRIIKEVQEQRASQ